MFYTIVVLSIAALLNLFATRKLLRAKRMLDQTKRLHLILVWLIPFVWAVLILLYSDDPPEKGKGPRGGGYMNSGYQGYYFRSS